MRLVGEDRREVPALGSGWAGRLGQGRVVRCGAAGAVRCSEVEVTGVVQTNADIGGANADEAGGRAGRLPVVVKLSCTTPNEEEGSKLLAVPLKGAL